MTSDLWLQPGSRTHHSRVRQEGRGVQEESFPGEERHPRPCREVSKWKNVTHECVSLESQAWIDKSRQSPKEEAPSLPQRGHVLPK